MAILSKIQKRSGLLLVVIGFSLLAFLVGDAIQSGTFSMGSNNAGSVNGTDIIAQELSAKAGAMEKQSQGMSAAQAQNNAWEQEVRSILLNEQFEKLGITVGKDQVLKLIKQNPYFAQNPQLLNAAGQIDDAKFNEFVKSIKNAPDQAQWNEWLNYEKEVEKSAKEQLYFTMIRSGMYATQTDAKARYEAENNKVDFKFVAVPFTTVNDDEAKVSDEELLAYMEENKKKYKSDETRTFDFVIIETKPSAADEEAMKGEINGYLTGMTKYNEATQKTDTLPGFAKISNADVPKFVNSYSAIKFDSVYVSKKDLAVEHQEALFNLASGQVYGPYIADGYLKLSRKLGSKAASSAKASHILIAYAGAMQAAPTIKRTKEEAKALADNLLGQAQSNPANFAMLAMMNTDDPGSKQTGGMYDNIQPNQMVKPFNDFVFNSPVGRMGIVETDFGYHVIKVDDKYDAVLLGTVALKIQPSDATMDQIYTKATKFEADANEKDFEKVAKESNLTVNPAPGIKYIDEYLPVVGAQRQMVTWAYGRKTKIGDVQKFEIPQGYAIAKLKSINDSGLLDLEQAKQQVLPIVRNKKKAEIIRKKMNGTSLDAVSKATSSTIQTATAVSLINPFVPNIGQEPQVVGKAFGLANGKTSGVIEGFNGMFMVQKTNDVKAPATSNYSNYINQLKQQGMGSVGRVLQVLKDKAEIKDNRANVMQ